MMRYVAIVIIPVVLILAAVLVWMLARGDEQNLLPARDALLTGDLVVDYLPGLGETERGGRSEEELTARTTVLADGRWIYDRSVELDTPGDTILFDGSRYLARIAEGCYIAVPEVALPTTIGVTDAQRSDRIATLQRADDNSWEYSIDQSDGSGLLHVHEDLRALTDDGLIVATATGDTGPEQAVFTIRAADAATTGDARQLLDQATAAPVTGVHLRFRSVIADPEYAFPDIFVAPAIVLLARDCPTIPFRLLPEPSAQAPGGLISVAPFRLTAESPPRAEGVIALDDAELELEAPDEDIVAAVERGNAASVVLRPGAIFATASDIELASATDGDTVRTSSIFVYEIERCESVDWFQCGSGEQAGDGESRSGRERIRSVSRSR